MTARRQSAPRVHLGRRFTLGRIAELDRLGRTRALAEAESRELERLLRAAAAQALRLRTGPSRHR